MQAVVVAEFGGPEVLVAAEVPDPVAGAGEVVVAVAAAHVLWVETRIRSGVGREYWGVTPPYVPGAGSRAASRTSGPESIRPCSAPGRGAHRPVPRRVRGARRRRGRRPGPDPGRGVVPAGGGPRARRRDGRRAGGRAAGRRGRPRARGRRQRRSWGSSWCSWPRARGARVVALARDERKLARVAGARRRRRDRLRGPRLDGAGARRPWAATAPTWSSTTSVATSARPPSGSSPPAAGSPPTAPRAAGSRRSTRKRRPARDVTVRGIRDVQLPPAERRRLTEQAIGRRRRGRLRPVIGQTFPLARADRAHAALEDRSVFGSTLLL